MKQVLFRIPGLGVTVYGFTSLLVVAISAGWVLAGRRSRRERLDPDVVYGMAPWLVIGGLVGARLFYVAEYWGERVTTAGEALRVWDGGLVFYGGVLGATAAFFLYRAVRAFPVLATLDALAPAVALGVALGRVGCFLNGSGYGKVCRPPWPAVRFPAGSWPWAAERARMLIPRDAPYTLPLHPTQLYSALSGLLLFALVSAYFPVRRRDGEVMALLTIAYPVGHFVVDFLRDDEATFGSGLTIGQVASLALFAAGLTFWSRLSRRRPFRRADAPA